MVSPEVKLEPVAGGAAPGVDDGAQRAAARVGAVNEIAEPVDRIDERQIGAGASQLASRLGWASRVDRTRHMDDLAAAGSSMGHSAY